MYRGAARGHVPQHSSSQLLSFDRREHYLLETSLYSCMCCGQCYRLITGANLQLYCIQLYSQLSTVPCIYKAVPPPRRQRRAATQVKSKCRRALMKYECDDGCVLAVRLLLKQRVVESGCTDKRWSLGLWTLLHRAGLARSCSCQLSGP